MKSGLLIAYAQPRSPEVEDEFNEWYSSVHLPEMVATTGVRSACRFRSLDGSSRLQYLAMYRLEAMDLGLLVDDIMRDQSRTPTQSLMVPYSRRYDVYEEIDRLSAG